MNYFYTHLIAISIIVLGIVKILIKLTTGWCKTFTCLAGRTVIVTGANTGIGYEAALDFARRGAKVILACRNEDKANKARAKIIRKTQNNDIHVKIVDFGKLESIRNFAEDINANETKIDILVNNAGSGGLPNRITQHGLQLQMQINYFASVLLTNLLLPSLKKAPKARVINVGSIGGIISDLDPTNLNYFPGNFMIYGNSKLCNILFTIELAKCLEGTNITTYSLHPGIVRTEIFRRLTGLQALSMKLVLLWFKSAEEGAQTTIYLATANDIEHYNGKYFLDCEYRQFYKNAKIPGLSKKVWDKTNEMLNLKPEDWQI